MGSVCSSLQNIAHVFTEYSVDYPCLLKMNNETIILVRHGQTMGNLNRLYYGKTDFPLTEYGEKELLELRKKEIYPKADFYYTSGMTRTNQTINIIYPDTNFIEINDIKEFDFGDFEGSNHEQISKLDEYIKWISDSSGEYSCPNGESKNVFVSRVINAYKDIVSKHKNQTIAIICHGGVISTIMDYLFPNVMDFWSWQPQNGCGYLISNGCYKALR